MRLVVSIHDVSEGGLFAALMESAMCRNLGFDVKTDENFRKDAYLFGENQSRVVVSISASQKSNFEQFLQKENQKYTFLGEVKTKNITIDQENFGEIKNWKKVYENELAGVMEK